LLLDQRSARPSHRGLTFQNFAVARNLACTRCIHLDDAAIQSAFNSLALRFTCVAAERYTSRTALA
jgi:hypothetical protein